MEFEKAIYLEKLIKFSEDKILRLEKYYKENDKDKFNSTKKLLLQVQQKISKGLE